MSKKLVGMMGLLLLGIALGACAAAAPDEAATAVPQEETEVVAMEAREIEAVAEAFVAELAAGEFETAVTRFDETMAAAMPAGRLGDAWGQLLGVAGAYVGVQGTRLAQEQGYDIAYVTAEFADMPMDIKVVFDDAGQIAGLFFTPPKDEANAPTFAPPPYADPDSFTEQNIIVGEGTEWALPGTLTLPTGEGPFPAVVLVHGSGPNDRDETIGPNKPFRDLAQGLAGQGIASLRYDKRTLAHQTAVAMDAELTVQEETVDDAVTAVALLRQTPGIDPGQVFVLGHSLGGTLIPRIGAQAPDAAGLIVLAGADRPLEDLMLEQVTYIFGLDGEVTDAEQTQLDTITAQVAAIKDLGLAGETLPEALAGAPAAYWLDLRGYVPSEVAQTLAQPLLILQGERDYQVTMEDFGRWQAALQGRENVTFKSYPALNHLFMAGEGPSSPAEYEQPGYVAEEVIRDIAAWIQSRGA